MHTLNEVTEEVRRQVIRDYGNRSFEDICRMFIMGLTEEAGEVAGLEKRKIRNFSKDKSRCTPEKYLEELGDVLWYLTACCISNGFTLEDIWKHNVEKLEERYGG